MEIKEHLITNTSLVCGAYELETIDIFLKAFNNSISLPKGHGKIIDENKITKCGWNFIDHHAKTDAPTIIEADTESEE